MELSTITTFFASPSGLGLVLLLALVVERLIKGGYLGIRLGGKTLYDYSTQESRDGASVKILMSLSDRMGELEQHFNHETTEQYEAMLKSQEKILDAIIRIERDGIRIKQ